MKHILTITGPSGAGKDTLLDALLVRNNVKLPEEVSKLSAAAGYTSDAPRIKVHELVSHTTRSPRAGEVDGIDYYFVSLSTFEKIEKVEETEYAGNHYCLSADELRNLEDEEWGVVIVDQHGVECIRNFVSTHSTEFDVTSIFLHVSAHYSEHRMKARGDKAESIERRLTQQEERNEYFPNNNKSFDYFLMSETQHDCFKNVELIQKVMVGR